MSLKQPFVIRAFDVGPGGRLSIRSLCNYLAETAGLHAATLGVSLQRMAEDGLAWVLHRLRVRSYRLPALDEEIVVESWPSAFEPVQAHRDFIVHGPGGERLAEAASVWLLMRTEQRRLARLPAWVREIPVPDRPRTLDPPFPELPPIGDVPPHSATFEVRRDDLDILGHLNNSRYAAFVAESLPRDEEAGRWPAEIDLVFRSEALEGDCIRVESGSLGSGAYRHRLLRQADGTLLADATTCWQP